MKRLALVLCSLFFTLASFGDDTNFQKQPDKPVDLARDKNLYVVGYAHLDTQWRWTYPYVIQNFIRNTMEQNFPLIEKYPDYVFNFTGSRRYEFMKEYYPEDYAKVKQYVAAGRWFPAGSSVDECDANIPSLESFTRHFLYGNRFFQHEFGIQSDEFMLPDCFGFPASLPEILAHGGIKGFSTQKLTWGSAVGIPFKVGTWIGPDGSSVTAALDPGSYTGSVNEDLSHSEEWQKRIDATGDKSGIFADYHYYGTGDRGGAPGENSVKMIEQSLIGGGPVRIISGPADRMFKDIAADPDAGKLPTYKGDLLLVNHSAGSLSSEAYMKRWNRQNEQLAAAAEAASTTANWLKAFPYPSLALYNAWDLVLGSQMHDIMPGTSLPTAYNFSWNDEVVALNQFAGITEHATAAVVANMDTTAKGVAVAVYNPLTIDREDAVEASIPITGTVPDAVTAYDPQGQPVPTQILGKDGDNLRVLFIAKVPSVGYALYDIRPGAAPAAPATLNVTANSLENARYKVTLNDAGDISSIFDKSLNKELLSAPTRLSIHTENPSAYPAWNMDWEDRNKPARGFVDGPPTIKIIESGPARVALEVTRMAENGVYTQDIRLASGSGGNRVEVLNHIDWRSFKASLKADFPFAAGNPNASFEDKVGVTQRDNDKPNRFEMPLQQWMDLTDADGSYGVTVMSDSKYGSDKPDDHTLRLTLVYTPGTRGGSRDQGTQDQGRHEILFALAGHKGDWSQERTSWQAARLNQPLRSFITRSHSGWMGRTFSMMSVNSDQVQVTSIKKAEDTDEVVIRMKELTGQPAPGVLVRFASPIIAAREIDAQERPIGNAVVSNGKLALDMKPFSLHAFALKLAPPPQAGAAVVSQPVSLTYDVDAISTNAKQDDGAMDSEGGTYPAELLPDKLAREGVDFQMGPSADGQMNAMSASGQNIKLPAGQFNRVHLLVAADGDTTATIKLGTVDRPFNVPNWTGFIGQWDNRLWDGEIHELDYDPAQKTVGLVPGYIKRTPIAWFATHHNTPKGDAFYRYCYLFQLSYDLPAGATTLTLPNNPKIRVFAASVSREPDATPAAAPLYDTLADHQPGGQPFIPQDGKSFTSPTEIEIVPPLYHQPGDLHYTLDGSEPTASSPVYDSPIYSDDTVNIAARQVNPDGSVGPIVHSVITITDSNPPALVSALVDTTQNTLNLTFTKKLDPATAANAKNYVVSPSFPVSSAALGPDGRQVMLSLGAPLVASTSYMLSLSGIKDSSKNGNMILPATIPFSAQNVVYRLDSATMPDQAVSQSVTGLPMDGKDSWTLNVLVKPESMPDERTLIAGFGSDAKDPAEGLGRYIALFSDGIQFWSANRNVQTNSPLAVGQWQMITVTYDGKTAVVYKDGEVIGKKDVDLVTDPDATVNVGKPDAWGLNHVFHGSVQALTIRRAALNGDEVKTLFTQTKPAE